MPDWIGHAVLIAAAGFMYWQAHRSGRDADRAEAARRAAEAAERRAVGAQEATRTLHAETAGIAATIDHRTTGRTVYSYGPDGEIKEDPRG